MKRAVRTISFRRHEVRRGDSFPHAGRLVRDKALAYDRIVEALVEAWHARARRVVQTYDRVKCRKFLAKLERELEGPVPVIRMLRVALWYERHWDEPFTPVVDSGESFYRKFSRLEGIVRERTRQGDEPTVDAVVVSLFNGSRVSAETFRSDVLAVAKQLNFGRAATGDEVARCLAELYSAMRDVRAASTSAPSSPGLLELLRRYVLWLGDRDWQMTVRVLSLDAPAFAQFRREEAARHPHGADPLTGWS